ncbi:iron complex outermembrane recepter protein [Janthinobacterium sp. OK676]|uniref:TonB-dependent siderophore receptor n=1 Tax=Janthinobacterium sp. OK676 TaxID=1855295 RepID=UPI0008842ADD|nr:TonB-dependent siderophore receptor [Janthinobacterium sp. OK676]SDN22227.1 iron complex outermembrane recepter protein [Janthinobacterium sp. OK676]
MHRKNSRLALRKLILPGALAGIFALSAPSGVHAQQAPAADKGASLHDYDLKAGLLVQTLEAIENISGRRIDFDRADLAKGHAKAVNGNLSAGAAISQALAGTRYVLQDDGVGTLSVTSGATVEVVARRDQAETEFKADRSDTATRGGTSLHMVPASVTLITSKVLESQQATDLTEALRNVSGMSLAKTPQNNTTFGVRGFDAGSNSNGLTDNSAVYRNVLAVERVEVLKGPQAILSGGNSLGGAVNIVVKKPQTNAIRDLTVQYGSFGDKTIGADLSGKIGDDERLSYRTVGSVQDMSHNQAGMDGKKSRSILQALRWKDAKTDFIASAEYSNDKNPLERYTFSRRDGVILPVPTRLLGNRADGVDVKVRRFGYQLEHKFSDDFVLVSRLQDTHQDFDLHISSPNGLTYASGAASDSPKPEMLFFASRVLRPEDTLSGDHYMRLNFATGEVRHKLSVGFNHTNDDQRQTQYSGDFVRVPVYSSTPYNFQDLRERATTLSLTSALGQRQRGIYAQDMMTYEKWNLLLNWRRTSYSTPAITSTYYGTPENFVFQDAAMKIYHTSPGAGLVYQLNDETSLYASYSEGFQPNTSLACGGGFVQPMQTHNREIGAKFDLFDSKFTLTTSAFSMQQSNSLVYDRVNDCYNSRQAQRTQGAEIDAQGRLLPGLEAIFNYTYTQVTNVSDATVQFAGQPKHRANLWAVYKFQRAELKGLGVGVGISGKSSSLGSLFEPFTLPGGAQVDASVYYTTGPWSATVGVKNVFNRLLYDTTTTGSYIPVVTSRVYALTVKRSFK